MRSEPLQDEPEEKSFFGEEADRKIGSSTPGKERGVYIGEYGDSDHFLYGQDTDDDEYVHKPGFSVWTYLLYLPVFDNGDCWHLSALHILWVCLACV